MSRMQSKYQNLICKNKTKEFKLISRYIVKIKLNVFLLNIVLLNIAHALYKISSNYPFIHVHEQRIYIE